MQYNSALSRSHIRFLLLHKYMQQPLLQWSTVLQFMWFVPAHVHCLLIRTSKNFVCVLQFTKGQWKYEYLINRSVINMHTVVFKKVTDMHTVLLPKGIQSGYHTASTFIDGFRQSLGFSNNWMHFYQTRNISLSTNKRDLNVENSSSEKICTFHVNNEQNLDKISDQSRY